MNFETFLIQYVQERFLKFFCMSYPLVNMAQWPGSDLPSILNGDFPVRYGSYVSHYQRVQAWHGLAISAHVTAGMFGLPCFLGCEIIPVAKGPKKHPVAICSHRAIFFD